MDYRPPPHGQGRGYFSRGGAELGPAFPHLRPGRDRSEEARAPPLPLPPSFGPWGLEQRDFPRPLWERPPPAGGERYPPPPPPPPSPQGPEATRYHPCPEQPPLPSLPPPPHLNLNLQHLEPRPQEQPPLHQFRDRRPPHAQAQPFPETNSGGQYQRQPPYHDGGGGGGGGGFISSPGDGPGPGTRRHLHPADHGRGSFLNPYRAGITPWSNEPSPHYSDDNNNNNSDNNGGGGGGGGGGEAPPAWQTSGNFALSRKDPSLGGQRPHPGDGPSGDQFSHRASPERAQLWLARLLSGRRPRGQSGARDPGRPGPSVSRARESVLAVCRLTAELEELCRRLKQEVEDETAWNETYREATELRGALQGQLKPLKDATYVAALRKELERVGRKRRRIARRKEEQGLESQEQEERAAEREAKIDAWRMKRIHEVEEKKKERELKAAADAVLAEVRKKQADAKRIADILCALEKLRKLRKEAAARKAVHPPASSDEIFQLHIERLRIMIKKRSELYDAEERALRVMLEGEQEEERKREREKKLKKQRENLESQQREVEFIMFGDPELPLNHPLRPFRQYYLQTEHSPHVLVQIRQEWDRYLVPEDHPDGSYAPHGWIFPAPPSHDTWATALGQIESW